MNSTIGDDDTATSKRKKGSFDVYAEGGTSAEILLTLQLVLVTRRWRSLLDDKLRPIRQSSARMEAMSAIFNSRELPAQVDIARRLRIEGPTLTRMLARLETEGLVERLADPNDKRNKHLRLRAEGTEALKQIFDVADIYRDRLLSDVSPETIASVNGFLHGLLEKLDQGLSGPDGEA